MKTRNSILVKGMGLSLFAAILTVTMGLAMSHARADEKSKDPDKCDYNPCDPTPNDPQPNDPQD
ncbi:MAG TPA: hypothetical protein VF449_06595 [Parvibaculum sp.]